MTLIISKHGAPLSLPGGTVLPAGKTVSVKNWDRIKSSDLIQAWLRAGAIEVEQTIEDEVNLAPVAEAADVEIPDDWATMSWQERRSLASRISSAPVHTSDEVNAAIRAELDRRAR